jgi:hypothetical protein
MAPVEKEVTTHLDIVFKPSALLRLSQRLSTMANVDDVALQAESLAPLINTFAILFVVLSTVSVALRLYTRKQVLDAVGPDDISIAIAQVLAIVCSVTTVMEVFWGLGRHTKFVDSIVATKQLKV